MISGKVKKFSFVILVLIVLISLIGSAYGAGLRASPPEFKYNLTSSQTVTGQVTVTNIGDVPMNVTVNKKRLLMDSIHLLYSDGGIATWISVNPTNFTLAPGASKVVSFTVKAPSTINYSDAEGALIIGGLPIQSQNNNNSTFSSLAIKQGIELVIKIIAGLPGPIIESIQMLQHSAPTILLSYMPGDFTYQLNNNGTVVANMNGSIEINGLLSKHNVPINGSVYPEDNYTLTAQWTPGFADFGLYSADTNINYGRYQQDKLLQVHDTILVIPVWLILIIILAVAIWIIRKKEIQSPINIKIERKK
ncbi:MULTISPECIES: hypothetical protein [Methanobacterium]|jgi:hypothetical protein|uniref:DUF916 domain-containing protein n=1 Tax=Methanobacterium veterum TaxID=408577 RepID=A0A9E4ZWN9_9EURY|nr:MULTISPECIES: hypothetical protein [Methanobacterium]MCZ3366937.1 hypothetical protein [Methanobacterium veterum]MCZ3373916.1 hypothetical protein [Methanobacterium veterum]